jgi:hypothetical protein
MSEQQDDLVYDSTGALLGQVVPTEDGGYALVSPEGQVIGAVDADLNPVDASEYEVDDGIPDNELDELEALEARADELEERADEVERLQHERRMWQPAAETEAATLAALDRQRDRLEAMLGRPMTLREQRDLVMRAMDDYEAGEEPDLLRAAAEMADEGHAVLHDLDAEGETGRRAREDFIRERVEELGDDAPDVVTGQLAPRREVYDNFDDPEQRLDFAMDRLAGHDPVNPDTGRPASAASDVGEEMT